MKKPAGAPPPPITPEPEFDRSGYPTERTLKLLTKWPMERANEALDFIASAWHWDHMVKHELEPEEALVVGAEPNKRYLRLATGGWSGNEELLEAFEHSLCYGLTWQLSARGGLHIFEYRNIK